MFWIMGGDELIRSIGKVTGNSFWLTLSNQMEHPAWNGFHFYDLIFPLFLFIAGVATPYSVGREREKGTPRGKLVRRVIRRGLVLVLLGIIYNNGLRLHATYRLCPASAGNSSCHHRPASVFSAALFLVRDLAQAKRKRSLTAMQFRETQSIYLQIADYVCEKILLREWRQGDRIPSVRELAVTLEVNPNTIMKSYEFLQVENIIFNQRGIGFFASLDAVEQATRYRKDYFIEKDLPQVFRNLYLLGMDMDSLKPRFGEFKTNMNKNNK